MKKLLPTKSPISGAARLAETLRRLLVADPEVAAYGGFVKIYEAWAVSGQRVKARAEIHLPDGSYHFLTRIVELPLPPEQSIPHRGWTILLQPTWYGFGYQLFDESGAAVSRSVEDVAEADFATQLAQREIGRLLTERIRRELEARLPVKKPSRRRTAH